MPEPASVVAGAQAQTNALVAGIQKSITDAVAGAANKISTKFAERVDKELAEMTTSFKATHPAVTQAVTDVVGYTDAVKTTSVAIRDSAKQLKETSAWSSSCRRPSGMSGPACATARRRRRSSAAT